MFASPPMTERLSGLELEYAIALVYSVDVDTPRESDALSRTQAPARGKATLLPTPDTRYRFVAHARDALPLRPLVVGMGPCGLFAALVLVVPTFAMGGTLSAAARAVVTQTDAIRHRIALIYAANTLGAVSGALLATFVLLEHFGNRRTLWLACALNAAVALAALLLAPSSAAASGLVDRREGIQGAKSKIQNPKSKNRNPKSRIERPDPAPETILPPGTLDGCAAQDRGEGEPGDSDDERTAAPVTVTQRAAHQQQPGQREGVGGDDPLQ